MNNIRFKSKLPKLFVIIGLCIGIYLYFRSNITYLPVEDLYIPSAIGVDINKLSSNDVQYIAGISAYIFSPDGKMSSTVQVGKAETLAETRGKRQLHSDHRFILGLEKVDIYGSDLASYSLRPFITVTFKNPNINDTSSIAVYGGKIEELLNTKVQSYPSVGDFLEGLLKKSTDYNFFSDNYKLMDIYVRLDAEGRNVVLPYINLVENEPTITGMALFKKDKMSKVIDIDESKFMNLLRENKVRGMLTLQSNPKESIDYYASSKRKVKCKKIDNKYHFLINLNLQGDIASNTLFPGVELDKKMKKAFEESMSNYVEDSCKKFIYKMQNGYKLDCLELGKVAAAKYGRHTGVDWDKIICEQSIIDVKVKVKINTSGRGEY